MRISHSLTREELRNGYLRVCSPHNSIAHGNLQLLRIDIQFSCGAIGGSNGDWNGIQVAPPFRACHHISRLSSFMYGWSHWTVSALTRWRLEWRVKRESARIARVIYPALLESVRRKLPSTSLAELTEYAGVRAAQLSQERVDSIMRGNSELPGTFATRILLKSVEQSTNSVLAAVKSTSPRRAT